MPVREAVLTCGVALPLAAAVCGSVLVPLSIALTGGSAVPALADGPLSALAAGALVLTAGTVALAGLLALWSAAAMPGGGEGRFLTTVPGRHFPHPRRTRDHGR
ncbi:hypothetical protein [Streptomyces qaidamensis]|nr:hypothetical protein [Streptomyces qaidamensis]